MRSTWLVLAALLFAPNVARAEPARSDPTFHASLEYSAPPSCPNAAAFERLVSARLGFDPFGEDAPDHVVVSIVEGARGLDGRLEWRDERGHWAGDQTFPAHATDCAEVARAIGLALAVQIHLLANGRPPDAARTHSQLSADATKSHTSPPPAASASPRPGATPTAESREGASSDARDAGRRTSWSFALGGGGTLAVGMSPSVMALGRVFGSLATGMIAFELGGELSTRSLGHRADGAGFSERVLLASVAGCGTPGPFSLCLLAKAGVANATGRSIDEPASSSGPVVQLGLRGGLRQRVGEHGFVAERVEGVFNVTRPQVTLDEIPVWTAPVLAASLGFDAGVVF